MYFIEYALREAIEKAIAAAIKKINTSPQSTKPGEQDFKTEEINILNELKTEVLALTISEEEDTPNLDDYLDNIQSACFRANEKAAQKAETFRKVETNTGSTFDSTRMSKEFTSKVTNIINNIVNDFTKSSARPIDFEAHKFTNLARYTEETHGKNWLCHFIRGRFDYKTTKLAEIHINNVTDATYRQKIDNIDDAYHNWASLEALYCNYQLIKQEAELAKATLKSLLPAHEQAKAEPSYQGSRPKKNKLAAKELDSPSSMNEIAAKDESNPIHELIRNQNNIIRTCDETLLKVNLKILRQAILGFVQICKNTDKSIQMNSSSFFNRFLPQEVSESASKAVRAVGYGRGTYDSIITPFLNQFEEHVHSAADTQSLKRADTFNI